MSLNYSSYLSLDDLLSAQNPRSRPEEHDETLFIIFHQITELWFKQLLHDLDRAKQALFNNNTYEAVSSFTRIRRIFSVLADQWPVLETITPLSFSQFRTRLETASGFQSMQFREIEFVLGMKRPDALAAYPDDLPGIDSARRRLHEPSLVDAFHEFLVVNGVRVPGEIRNRPVDEEAPPNEVIQDGLLACYIERGELRVIFELMTDIDEAQQLFRYRHAKMAERTIGDKLGTSGTSGVAYLRAQSFRSCFPDLWAVRAQF